MATDAESWVFVVFETELLFGSIENMSGVKDRAGGVLVSRLTRSCSLRSKANGYWLAAMSHAINADWAAGGEQFSIVGGLDHETEGKAGSGWMGHR